MSTADSNAPQEKVFVGLVRSATAESQRWAEPLVARLAAETWRLRRRLARIDEANGDDDRLRPLRDSVSRLDDILAEYHHLFVAPHGDVHGVADGLDHRLAGHLYTPACWRWRRRCGGISA